jgi:hypothetical protein
MGVAVHAGARRTPSFTPVRADSLTRCGDTSCSCGCERRAEEDPTTRARGHDFGRMRVDAATRAPNGAAAEDELLTKEGDPAPAPKPAPKKEEEKKPPAKSCKVASGPTYTPSGTVPVTKSGGKKKASFKMAASFTKAAADAHDPACCEVRQFIKWDEALEKYKGGPPHSGFPSSTKHGTWIEDRDENDKRYGHRAGTHSDPIAACGDEYKTGATRDQASGDKYCGSDAPEGPEAVKGQYQFQLKVVDTCNADAVKQSSSIITINWSPPAAP